MYALSTLCHTLCHVLCPYSSHKVYMECYHWLNILTKSSIYTFSSCHDNEKLAVVSCTLLTGKTICCIILCAAVSVSVRRSSTEREKDKQLSMVELMSNMYNTGVMWLSMVSTGIPVPHKFNIKCSLVEPF